MKQNDPLFMLGGETFSQEDFKTVFSNNLWKFSIIKNGQSERAMAPELDVNSSEKDFVYFIFNNYVKSCIMDREYDWLYKNNPEYRNLLNEYKDGLLLFDISQREVWGKSARDAVKLTEFFEANKEKYSFSEPKFRGSIIYCKNEKIKKKAEKLLAKGMSAEDVVNELKEDFKKEEKPAYLKVGLFAKGNNEAVDANIFKSAE
jgi:peptidyl-prolyl cis-trans isomerase SurA